MHRIAFISLVGFLVFIYFEPTYLFPQLAVVRPALALSLTALVAAMASGGRLPRGPQTIWLLFFLFWAGIATLAAISTEASFERFPVLFKAVALYAVVAMIVRTPEQIVQFARINIWFGAVVSIVTVLTMRAGIEPLGGGDMYRMVNYFGGIGDDPNEFGALMLALLPLPLFLMAGEQSKTRKVVLALIALSFLLCVMRTRSRGAFLGLIVIAPFISWEHRRKFSHVLFIVLIAAYAYANTHAGYWDRIATTFSEEAIEADFSASSRLHQQGAAIALMRERPIFGVGPGNFVIGKIRLLGEHPEDKMTWVAPHNSYLGLGSEVGVPGLLAFLATISLATVGLGRTIRRLSVEAGDSALVQIAKATRVGLLGFCVAAYFLSEQYNTILYMWMALSAVLAQRVLAEPGRVHLTERGLKRGCSDRRWAQ